MAKLKLKTKDIRAIGYPEGLVISIAMNVMEKKFKFEKEDIVMNLLRSILASPIEYENDAVLGLIAQQLLPKTGPEGMEISLNKTGVAFNIFGKHHSIECHSLDSPFPLCCICGCWYKKDKTAIFGE